MVSDEQSMLLLMQRVWEEGRVLLVRGFLPAHDGDLRECTLTQVPLRASYAIVARRNMAMLREGRRLDRIKRGFRN